MKITAPENVFQAKQFIKVLENVFDIACPVWDIEDVFNVAEIAGISIFRSEAKDVVKLLRWNHQKEFGITFQTVQASIEDVIRNRESNFENLSKGDNDD